MSAPAIEWVEQTASTNDDVLRRMANHGPHGTTICAHHQTAGRGRHGRTWVAPPGATLSMSIGVRHPALARHLPFISLATGCATAQMLNDELRAGAGVKWPNDILVDGRKVGGILCEAVSEGSRLVAAVIGIGLNANLCIEELPEPLNHTAASLHTLCGSPVDVRWLANSLRQHVMQELHRLFESGPAPMLSTLRALDVTQGRRLTIDGGRATGIAVGIADSGGLIVAVDDGSTITITSGEVLFLPPSTQ